MAHIYYRWSVLFPWALKAPQDMRCFLCFCIYISEMFPKPCKWISPSICLVVISSWKYQLKVIITRFLICHAAKSYCLLIGTPIVRRKQLESMIKMRFRREWKVVNHNKRHSGGWDWWGLTTPLYSVVNETQVHRVDYLMVVNQLREADRIHCCDPGGQRVLRLPSKE